MFYRCLPSFLSKAAGHHSNRDTFQLEAGEALEGYSLAHPRLKFRGLGVICSVQKLCLSHTHLCIPRWSLFAFLLRLGSQSQLSGRAQDPLSFSKKLSHTSFTRWQQILNMLFSAYCTASVCEPGPQRVKGLREESQGGKW